MASWWDFGEWSGFPGRSLALSELLCAYCGERGQYAVVNHVETTSANGLKKLNFETLKCANCANFALAFWSASTDGEVHDRKIVPWPHKARSSFPKHWPADAGRFWVQAHNNLREKNWDAASVMARSALQVAFRHHDAAGADLKQEIQDLASRALLPPIIREWSDHLRELGIDAAHPKPGQAPSSAQDARDIVQFLDFLLEYLFDLPQRVKVYRERKEPPVKGDAL